MGMGIYTVEIGQYLQEWCLENRTATSELDIHVVITRVTIKIIDT